MNERIKKIAEEIFTNPRMQAFFKNPPPEGPTEAGEYPANEECCEIVYEIAETIEAAFDVGEPYILKADRDKPPGEQTVFYIRRPTPEQLREHLIEVSEKRLSDLLMIPVESTPGTAESLPCGTFPCIEVEDVPPKKEEPREDS